MRPSLGCTMRLQTSTGASALAQTPLAGGRVAAFSTTAHMRKRKTKDNNKQRGVSSLYRSGPREPLSMSKVPLPKPRAQYKPTVETNEKHGLWGFFPEPKKLMYTPKEMEEHGRAWTIEELRRKSWEDLHALWWTCCKERNMLFTSMAELKRANLGFGKQELDNRVDEVCAGETDLFMAEPLLTDWIFCCPEYSCKRP